MRSFRWWLLLLAAVMIGGLFLLFRFYGRQPSSLVLSGTIESRQIEVGSRMGGRIAEVLVQEGASVEPGQVLVRLETYDLEARRRQAEARIQEARAALQKLRRGFRPEEIAQAEAAAQAALAHLDLVRRGPRPQEIEQARAELQATTAEARHSRSVHQRLAHLFETGVVSRQDLDNAAARLELAEAREKVAQERLDLLRAGSRPEEIEAAEKRYAQAQAGLQLLKRGSRVEDIAAAEATLAQAQASLQLVQTEFSEIEVRSPAQAIVEVLDVRPGDLVRAGAPLAVLLEPGQIYVQVYVPESRLGQVRPGLPVSVSVDSFPGRRFAATVAFVAQQGEFTPRNVQTRTEREHQVFAVRVNLDYPDGLLRPGMAADVHIEPVADLQAADPSRVGSH